MRRVTRLWTLFGNGQKRSRRAFKSYLRRQGLYHRLYKIGILKY